MKNIHATFEEENPDISYDEMCKQFKYKIYARKSTEDSGRQVRSIEDQISDCKALAKRLGLTVVGEPIREQKSAMEAGQRPQFTALLKELKSEKIDGIIAWHPDRLARNAIESGTILDMLDHHELKDLRFHSHQFSNDPNGKMLLGMLFTFVKHYSDDLGFKVRRGVRKRLNEGMSGGIPKHGYTQRGGKYAPDHTHNDNFQLIKNAWKMRLDGATLPEISQYLSDNDYQKHYHPEDKETGGRVDERRSLQMNTSTLSRMFRDPFYYGILIQAEQETDLTNPELGLNFEPMITKDEFLKVQDLTPEGKHKKGKQQIFMPCRNRIYCACCHDPRPMSVYMTGKKKNSNVRYLYFRCRNPKCTRQHLNIRASVVLDEIAKLLPQITSKLSDDAYEIYLKETKELSETSKRSLRRQNTTLKLKIERLRKQNNNLAEQITKLADNRIIDEYNQQISNNLDEIDNLNHQLEHNEETLKRKSSPQKQLTPQEFKEMMANTAKYFEKASVVRKDLIIREIFSNFYFEEEKIVNFSVKEPFATLLNVKSTVYLADGGG